MAYPLGVSPDNLLVTFFYIVAVVGAVLFVCLTNWSSDRISSRIGRAVVGLLVAAVLVEISSLIALKVNFGYWLYTVKTNSNAWLFEQHPNMVALMIGNKHYTMRAYDKDISLASNSLGFRGEDFPPKGDLTRVVTIGGSTTFGVDVSEWETWPSLLQQELGERFEVLNLGVAGHGTAEHLFTLGAVASRLKPDVVVFHIGLNDMHCMHAPEINPVFNRCHSDLLFLSTGQCFVSKLPRLATIHAFVSTMQNIGLAPRCPQLADGKKDFTTLDTRVVEDFKARTTALIAAAQGLGARVVVVPQVGFQKKGVASGAYQWWTPYLDQKSLATLMQQFNQELKDVANKMKVPYVEAVEQTSWTDDLFVDSSHLNGEGNEKLSNLVHAQVVQALSSRSH